MPEKGSRLNALLTRAGAAVLCCCLAMAAGAAPPKTIEPFDGKTWKTLSADVKKPTIVIFSATYCTHCPAVIQKIAKDKAELGGKVSLIGVVMDEEPPGLLAKPPYNRVDRVFVFEGHEQAVRYTINPEWRGITPYVAFMAPGKPVKFFTGAPPARELGQFLALAR
mgnify:CR=1 FL=1